MKTYIRKIAGAALLSIVSLTAPMAIAEDTTISTTTTSMGTVSEFSPDTIVLRSTTSAEPIRYISRKTTTYVDEAGAPVSMEVVRSGAPVTVQYVREGDRLIANRVIVRRTTVAPAPAPEVIEKRTTTTTTTRDRDDD